MGNGCPGWMAQMDTGLVLSVNKWVEFYFAVKIKRENE
jgi:hypothetical protein